MVISSYRRALPLPPEVLELLEVLLREDELPEEAVEPERVLPEDEAAPERELPEDAAEPERVPPVDSERELFLETSEPVERVAADDPLRTVVLFPEGLTVRVLVLDEPELFTRLLTVVVPAAAPDRPVDEPFPLLDWVPP